MSGGVALRYTLTLRGRVSAGSSWEVRHGRLSHEVIPGTTIRGALAGAWLDEHGGRVDEEFRGLFERSILFGQALPASSRLVPLSQIWCKYPGPSCPREHWDVAMPGADEAFREHQKQTACSGTEGGRGWDTRPAKTRMVESTRSAMTEQETAADEQLFTRRSLDVRTAEGASTVLVGQLTLQDDADSAWFRLPRQLRVGGQRSHLGLVDWKVEPAAASSPDSDDPRVEGDVVLRLLSPAVLVDDFGAPTTDLGAALGLGPGHVVGQWTRPTVVGGWHAAAGVPKPEEIAVHAGAVVRLTGVPAGEVDRLRAGLGLRRLEGFGQVEIVSLHQADEPVVATAPTPAPEPVRPPEPRRSPSQEPVQAPAPASEPEPVSVAEPERPAEGRLLEDFVEVAGTNPEMLTRLGAALRRVSLAQLASLPPSMVDAKRAEVLQMPWVLDLSGPAQQRLRELVAFDSAETMRVLVLDLKERS